MSWSPLSDPLAARELGSFSRRWTTYAVRVLYLGLAACAVWQFWRSAGADSVSDLALLGRDLFLNLVTLQMTLVPLAAAAAGSDLVSREARTGTLGLLVLTGLTSRRIAWAKWRAAMAYAGLLVLCGLPVVALAVYLGAAGPWDLAWSAALTGSLASLSAAMAIRFSATCETGGRAMFRAVLSLVGWSCLLGLACLPFTLLGVNASCWVHPVTSAIFVIGESTDSFYAWSWTGAAAASAGFTWLLLRDAGKRIARRVVAPPPPPKAQHGFGTLVSYYSKLRVPGRRRLVIERGVWDRRPLLWKELATRAAARITPSGRIAFLWFLAALGAFSWGAADGGRNLEPFYLPAAGVLLYAVGWGSFLFAREREGRRWDLLLSTPARPADIVAAKLLSGIVAPESLVLLFLLSLAIVGWSAHAGPARVLLMAVTVLLFVGFAYALAAAASLKSRTPRGAFVFTMGFLSVAIGVIPYLLALRGRPDGLDWLAGLSPVAVLEGLFARPGRRYVTGDLAAFAFFVGVYGSATPALLAAMVRGVRSAPEAAA